MASRQRFKRHLITLGLFALGKLSRRHGGIAPSAYLAFSIGPEMLATSVQKLDASDDQVALEKAFPLFHDGLKRVEVWRGTRKVGDIPPRREGVSDNDVSDNGAVRDSA
jgi:hypothetical protein